MPTTLTFKSEAQKNLFESLCEQADMTPEQAQERWPNLQGFQLINRLRDLLNPDSPTDQQRWLFQQCIAKARGAGKSALADHAEIQIVGADRDKMSSVIHSLITVVGDPRQEASNDSSSTAENVSDDSAEGDEGF